MTEEDRLDGVNGGTNGGRACWGIPREYILGLKNGPPPGGFVRTHCLDCGFFRQVQEEEGSSFVFVDEIFQRLERPPQAPRWT